MNGKQANRVIQALLLAILLLANQTQDAQAKSRQHLSSGESSERILLATIQISAKITLSPPAGQNGSKDILATAHGLGSLIEKDGIVAIITHNHWGEPLQDRSVVEFRDASSRLLVSMSGKEFRGLVLFQDSGTLVLKAPDKLLPNSARESGRGASLQGAGIYARGETQQIKPGMVVQVAVRQADQFDQITVLDVEVISLGSNKGVPTYDLRSLGGQPVSPGDSGGGVWHNGRLVGNVWGTLLVEKLVPDGNTQRPQLFSTDRSFAASLGW